jgi:hypothetical protein
MVHASAEGPHLIPITLNRVYTKLSHLREEGVERPSEWNASLVTSDGTALTVLMGCLPPGPRLLPCCSVLAAEWQ